MENIIYKFDEVLTDGYSCLLLGDVYSLQSFQNKSQLGDNLQNAFTTTKAGDDVVKYGDMIYLGNVQNPYDDGYTIFLILVFQAMLRICLIQILFIMLWGICSILPVIHSVSIHGDIFKHLIKL